MSVENTRAVMGRYFGASHGDVSMLADDVVFTVMGTGEEHHGPQGVLAMLHHFYSVAFEATVEPSSTVFGESGAVLEGMVVGKHIGEFAGIPATGKPVRVPICVVYDLEGDTIKRARVYLEMMVMMAQLGVRAG